VLLLFFLSIGQSYAADVLTEIAAHFAKVPDAPVEKIVRVAA